MSINLITPRGLWLGILATSVGISTSHADLKHRYSFDEPSGSLTVTDSIGGANGNLVNTTGNSQFGNSSLTLGNTGTENSNANPVNGDYVDLPNGLISSLVGPNNVTQFSFEVWMTYNGNGNWQRIWDFGTSVAGENSSNSGDATAQLFATAQSGGGSIRTAWRGQGLGELSLDRPGRATPGEEHHIVFVWDETTTSAQLYVNGSLVDQNNQTGMTIAANYAGFDVNVWLGRAQWPDPLFVGSYNEFRIWDSALNVLDVLNNFVNGPDNLDGPGVGDILSAQLSIGNPEIVVNSQASVNLIVDFTNLQGYNASRFPGVTYASSNTAVATVSPIGVVTGVGEGSASITASLNGQTLSVDVQVIFPPLPPAQLVHRYDFNEASGSTTLNDLIGDADGQALNVQFDGAGRATFLADQQSYVDLPNGIISSLDNVTLEAWVTFDGTGGNWQRIFDFGNTGDGENPPIDSANGNYLGNSYFFYAPRRGAPNSINGGRIAFSTGDFTMEGPLFDVGDGLGLPIGQEAHLAIIYNYTHRRATAWVNGLLVGSGAIPSDRPLSTLNDVNNWLGRSQYEGDAFLNGSFNEFRIYEGALTDLQSAINRASGPDTFVQDPGDVVDLSLQLAADNLNTASLPVPLTLVVDFQNLAGVELTGFPGVEYSSSDTSVIQIIQNPIRIVPVGPGSADITVRFMDREVSTSFTVASVGEAAQLAHRYSFDGNAEDSVGGQHGTLVGTGEFANGNLTLDGSGYVDLPDYLFSDFYATPGVEPAISIEIFGKWNGGSPWQRIFDFGDNTESVDGPSEPGIAFNGVTFFFLTPSSGDGLIRSNFNDSSGDAPALSAPGIPAGESYYIAIVFDPTNNSARLYRNGQLVDVQPIPDDQILLINDYNMWLGRSNFSGDANYNGEFQEFRIWTGSLQATDIAKHALCGPDQLDCEPPTEAPALVITQTNDNIILFWEDPGSNFALLHSAQVGSGANWTPVTATINSDGSQRSVVVSGSEAAEYFILRFIGE